MLHIRNKTQANVAASLCLVSLLLLPPEACSNPEIDDFLSEADIIDLELSPDGTHLAVITNKDGKRFISVRNIVDPEMPLVGALAGDLATPLFLSWGNNDRLLVAMSVPVGARNIRKKQEKDDDFDVNDFIQVSRMISIKKDMTGMVVLMEDEKSLLRNFSLSRVTNFLPNDDDHVLMAAYRNLKRVQFKVNINNGDAERVTTGSIRTLRFFNDDDGTPRFRFDFNDSSKAIVIYAYSDKGRWKKVEKIYLNRDDERSLDTAGLLAIFKDKLVYRRQNEKTGFYELSVVDNETGERSTLVSLPDQDIRDVLLSLRTDELVGYVVEEDYIRHVFFDEEMQAQYDRIAAQVGDYNFRIVSGSDERGVALVRSWGADDPRSYHLWTDSEGELTFLGHAYEKLATTKLAVPALVTYKTRDGQPIRSYLLFPQNYVEGEPHPTVLLPHGGPHARDRATYDSFAQFLATRGYVVAKPNFRGSVGYGRDFEEAGYRQWGGLMQDDLTDAVTFLVERGISDTDKICIVGGSYGGYAALMGAVKTPELYQCAVSMNGVTHLAKLVEYDMRNVVDREDWDVVLFDRIGHPKKDRDLLDAHSPALNADRIRIPILLVAGTEDPVVPFSQSKMMSRALKAADVDHEFIELYGSGHNPFYYRKDAVTVMQAVADFLKAHLGEPRSGALPVRKGT